MKKSTAKKSTAKKRTAAKSTAKKSTAAKSTAKKSAASKKPVKKKSVVKKTTSAKKVAAKTTTSKKAAAKKTPAATRSSRSPVSPKKSAAAKAAANKTPTTLPDYLTDKKWLKAQRDLLTDERKKYTHNAEVLAAEAHALMADREPGDVQFDEESGEGDTLAVERDRDLALSGLAREKVDEIDAALARLNQGTYGVCLSGDGDTIPKERLEYVPMAAKCVRHQTAMF